MNGQGASTDCRSNSGKCSCTVALQADYTFMASSFGEGSANVAAQYMVNQLAVADQNFRRTVLNNYMGYDTSVRQVTTPTLKTPQSHSYPRGHGWGLLHPPSISISVHVQLPARRSTPTHATTASLPLAAGVN